MYRLKGILYNLFVVATGCCCEAKTECEIGIFSKRVSVKHRWFLLRHDRVLSFQRKMASLPYVSFVKDQPVGTKEDKRSGLTAVGRCRICPESALQEEYKAILDLNVQQALVAAKGSLTDEDKKLKKKHMKTGVAMAKAFLTEKLMLDVSIVDVEVVLSKEDIVKSDGCLACCFLDAGCETVVVDITTSERPEQDLDAANIPKDRLKAHIAEYKVDSFEQTVNTVKEFCSAVSVEVKKEHASSSEDLLTIINMVPGVPVSIHLDPTEFSDVELPSLVGSTCAAIDAEKGNIALTDPSTKQLGSSYAACVRTDREDGLFTTVVCSRGGIALGLVYSSAESVIAALESGRGVYFSRSRGGLWRKGDTSGHFQTLHRLDVDCDRDALRFSVTQESANEEKDPAFCHLETYTCWGKPRGLGHLQGTLRDRLRNAPEGSYTKRLFDDAQLLRDKLVEEAQELSEAETPEHVAEELADVMYFAMVRAIKAGVTIDQAEAELDRRSRKVTRRQGDSKAFRIAAAQSILGK